MVAGRLCDSSSSWANSDLQVFAHSLQDIKLGMCASPVPPGPESVEALGRYKEKLGAFASSPDITGLFWKPVPVRFAVRLMFAKASFVHTQCWLHQQSMKQSKRLVCLACYIIASWFLAHVSVWRFMCAARVYS